MSEVLENKSKKKSDLSKEEGKVKKVNSPKSEELNKEKSKTGNNISNKNQSIKNEKENGNVADKGTAKKSIKDSTKQTLTDKISADTKSTRKTKKDETSNKKVTKNKSSENEKNTSKISSSKVSTEKTNTNKITNKKVSTNKTKQESKTNLDANNEDDKLKEVDEKTKNGSKSTNKNQQLKNSKSEKNRIIKKDIVSKENSKNDVDEKDTLKNQKSKNSTAEKENVKNEKIKEKEKQKEKIKEESSKKQSSKNNNKKSKNNSKDKEIDEKETNNLPAPESNFDTVSLKEIREALQNKVNDNQKQKVVKKVLINIGFAITMIVYLIIVALATKNIELPVLEKDLKIITLGIVVSGILVLERAYKKDNTQMAINAVEILVFGAINLCMIYIIKINFIKLGDFKDLINDFTYVSGEVAVYYILKSIIIAVKNVKKYKKENNDIKEIIKK